MAEETLMALRGYVNDRALASAPLVHLEVGFVPLAAHQATNGEDQGRWSNNSISSQAGSAMIPA